MDAVVQLTSEGFVVVYLVNGRVVDESEAYDDESDAADAARRNAYGFGTVTL